MKYEELIIDISDVRGLLSDRIIEYINTNKYSNRIDWDDGVVTDKWGYTNVEYLTNVIGDVFEISTGIKALCTTITSKPDRHDWVAARHLLDELVRTSTPHLYQRFFNIAFFLDSADCVGRLRVEGNNLLINYSFSKTRRFINA